MYLSIFVSLNASEVFIELYVLVYCFTLVIWVHVLNLDCYCHSSKENATCVFSQAGKKSGILPMQCMESAAGECSSVSASQPSARCQSNSKNKTL